MVRTIKGKLLAGTIGAVIVINIVFTIFITIFLDNNLRNSIIDEMTNIKSFAINTVKQNEIIEESKWKSLNSIKSLSKSYVAMVDYNGNISEYVSNSIEDSEINNIIQESNNLKSVIRFNKIDDMYCVTYNYPIYLENEFYTNIIFQKDYSDRYNKNIGTLSIIIGGQVVVVLAIILVVSIIINKITKPINILSKSMGDFSKSIHEEDILIDSNDEIGQLSKSYNLMKNQIRNQMEVIINEKLQIEKLQNESREFFNNATHELKTPVTAISLYAQILNDTKIDDYDEEFISRATDRIILESDKMKCLVEKILDVSKGKVNVNKVKSEFSLTELIENIVEDYEVMINRQNLIVKSKLDNIEIYSVLEDVEQIIINLLDNCIKYSQGRKIEIRLFKGNGQIIFEVSNRCLEFPEEIKARLLEPFIKYNTYIDLSKEISSSGLGLYLCKVLAEENGGSLSYTIEGDIISFILKL